MDEQDLATIRRWSVAMSHACLIAAILFLVGSSHEALTITPVRLADALGVPQVMLVGPRRIGWLVATVLPATVIAFGLLRVRRSFRLLADGAMFSPAAIRGFQVFSTTAMASVALSAISVPIAGAWLTYDTATGVDLPIKIGSGSATILLVSGITWVLARMLMIAGALQRRNSELATENSTFV